MKLSSSAVTLPFAVLTLAACSASGGDPGAGNSGTPTGGAGGASASTGGAPIGGAAGPIWGSGGTVLPGTPNSGGGSQGGSGSIDDIRNSSCASNVARTESAPSVLQLVVDTSGSMGDFAPGTFLQTKWFITQGALRSALNQLPPPTGVGVLYFPETNGGSSRRDGNGQWQTRPVGECLDLRNQVAIDIAGPAGSPHRGRLLASIDAPGRPNGGTPTHDAYKAGVDAIARTTLPGNRFVVLLTDGQPTYAQGCAGTGRRDDANDPRPIIEEARRAAQQGIRTFVIGSPGSEEANAEGFPEARTWLSMMATAGGTATAGCSDNGPNFCHFDMTQQSDFSKGLQDTLKLIVGTVVGCSYPIPAPTSGGTVDKEKVNVFFTPASGTAAVVPRFAGMGACNEGWQYSTDGTKVELCPGTCDVVMKDPNPQLEVIFGCETRIETPR